VIEAGERIRVELVASPEVAVVDRRARDDMVRSTVEAVALMSAFPEVLFRETEATVIVGIDALTDEEADALARVHEDVLQVLESMP
jgi:hypothetical protein